ncbi:hypothetical protein [Kamptonema formosum]|uniref:hypothetical protein n=1 Tax=Kamptonema formosum TaxID=331992 RepID=UPI0003461B54|nr:hypothetical protein [Oscillatoria sp. PCC 10802]
MIQQDANSYTEKPQVELESRLEDLKKENDRLRQQLNLLEGIYDFHATKIAAKAQESFTVWLRNSAIGITALTFLGGLSLIPIVIDYIKTESVKRSVEEIVKGEASQELRDKIIAKATDKVKSQVQDKMEKTTEAAVKQAVKEGLSQFNLPARIKAEVDAGVMTISDDIKKQNPASEFVQVVENSVGEEKYITVAGSSTNRADLEAERKRVFNASGGLLPQGLDSLKICPPKPGNQRFALVIGEPAHLDRARERVKLALANNFQKDTYALRASDAFFAYSAACK